MIVCGDNLKIMRSMDNESIDLIYLDPPFNSNANYKGSNGSEFKDKWSTEDVDTSLLREIIRWYPKVNDLIKLAGDTHSVSMASYLAYMGIRIIEMERLLKRTGSIYLHCDPTSSHYLRLLMDAVFGSKNFRNEIVWCYGKMSNTSASFPRNHDVILRYSKSDKFVFHVVRGDDSEYKERYRSFLTGNQVLYGSVKHKKDKLIHGRSKRVCKELGRDLIDSDILFDFDNEFKVQSDVIYIPIIKGNAKERTGYPTQKPIALLERIIKASSNEGDVVLDPFCGSGTTLVAAKSLGRRFIGIDISESAISLVKKRTEKSEDLFT